MLHSSPVTHDLIDNRSITYFPYKLKCGVVLHVSGDVFHHCPEVFSALEHDISDCLSILPRSIHKLIRRTRVWLNMSYAYGSIHHPKVLNHSTTHHCEKWLACVNDNPQKCHGIEIYNCFEYLSNRLHWNGCGLILHELCHIVHQLVLTNGLHNGKVQDMYDAAMASGKYEEVFRYASMKRFHQRLMIRSFQPFVTVLKVYLILCLLGEIGPAYLSIQIWHMQQSIIKSSSANCQLRS